MNILIVEDEIVVAMDLKDLVSKSGFNVIGIATTDQEVESFLAKEQIDLFLCDINLEDSQKDGIDIVSLTHIPTIYITAYCDEYTIQRAVKTEPLGYIIKPFKEDELNVNLSLAKYKLELESNLPQNTRIELGYGYSFDNELDSLFFYDMHIPLGKNEKKLLKLLLESKGNIVANSFIENEVWGDSIVSDNTRRTLIYRLRSKLEHRLIETIPDVGCRLLSV